MNLNHPLHCVLVSLAAAVLAGCSSTPPQESSIERGIDGLTGTESAFVFRTVGGPIDEQHASQDVLTLETAIRTAVGIDPRIQAAVARLRAAQASAKQARLLPNPILSIVFRFPVDGSGSPDVEAGLAAELITILRRPNQISAADSRMRAAAAEALSVVLDVLTEVQETYLAIQTSEQLLAVLEDRIKIIDRLRELAEARLRNRAGTRLDVIALDAQRVSLQADIAEGRLDLQEQRLHLTRLIGQPSGEANWRLPPRPQHRYAQMPDSRWVDLALAKRPEIEAARREVDARVAELRLAGWAPFDGTEVGIEAERAEGAWAVGPGATVPLPLFDTGKVRREQARAELVEARHELTKVQREVVEEVRVSLSAFRGTQENLERVRRELLPLAQERLAQAEIQFQARMIDAIPLLQAEEELRAARTRVIELEQRNAQSLYRLQRAVGGPGVAPAQPTTTTAPSTQPVGSGAGTFGPKASGEK